MKRIEIAQLTTALALALGFVKEVIGDGMGEAIRVGA